MANPIAALMSFLFKPQIMSVEAWAEKNSDLCSADDLIEGFIIQSFAKDYDGWIFREVPNRYTTRKKDITLRYPAKEIVITFTFEDEYSFPTYDGYETKKAQYHDPTINGLPSDIPRITRISKAYLKIKKERAELARRAAEAKRKMEENEAKWNLAEKLLGMKRNEYGALVPIVTAESEEHHCDCDMGESCSYCSEKEGTDGIAA